MLQTLYRVVGENTTPLIIGDFKHQEQLGHLVKGKTLFAITSPLDPKKQVYGFYWGVEVRNGNVFLKVLTGYNDYAVHELNISISGAQWRSFRFQKSKSPR